jgi:hypothetical protein
MGQNTVRKVIADICIMAYGIPIDFG